MKEINERIISLLNTYFKKNVSEMSRKVGIAQTTLNNIVSGKYNSPSFENLEKILNSMPNISSEWLMTGNGEMLKKDNSIVQSTTITAHNTKGNITGTIHNKDKNKETAINLNELIAAIKLKDDIINGLVKQTETLTNQNSVLIAQQDKFINLAARGTQSF